MKYTVRYAHLEKFSLFGTGDQINRGDIIGRIGNTGASDLIHLHIDCVEGSVSIPFRLADMESGRIKPAYRQLNYFIDGELFGFTPAITTYFNDPEYMAVRGKVHCAYDVVPEDRHRTTEHFNIHWNRSKIGKVIAAGYDHGYGNYIHVEFEA